MRSHTRRVISFGRDGLVCTSSKEKFLYTKSSTEAEVVDMVSQGKAFLMGRPLPLKPENPEKNPAGQELLFQATHSEHTWKESFKWPQPTHVADGLAFAAATESCC